MWEPPPEAASGLSIANLPNEFEYNETLLTVGFVEHVFESSDGSIRFSVARYEPGYRYRLAGENVVMDDRSFTHVMEQGEFVTLTNTSGSTYTHTIRSGVNSVLEDVVGNVQILVAGPKLDSNTLFRIALSVEYDPQKDTLRAND